MKLLLFIGIFFSFCMNSHALKINKLSSKNTLIFDLTDNSAPDLVLQWKNKTLIHHFIDNQKQKINISVRRVGKTLVKEFSTLENKNWKLTRREKYVYFSDEKIKKEIERFSSTGDSLGTKTYLVDENQASEITITPASVENILEYGPEDFSLSKNEIQNLMGASGDCHSLAIVNQGYQINLENILEKSYTTLDLKKFFNIQGCLKACDESNIECLTDEDKMKYCTKDLGSVFMNSIEDNLRCLNDLNPALGAQLAGLIFYNKVQAPDPDKCVYGSDREDDVSGCKKINIKCKDSEEMGDAWGSATFSCHEKWPSLNLSRMMCHQDKFIGPVSMSQTFLHESIHLLGYAHGEDPEMAYACTLACGGYNEVDGNSLNLIDNKVTKNRFLKKSVESADNICRNGMDVDGDYKQEITLAMMAYGKASLYDKFRSFQFNPNDYEDIDRLFENELKDARMFGEISKPICGKVWRVRAGQGCMDNYGTYRAKWIDEDVLGKPNSTSLVNILMFGDRESEVFQNLKGTLTSVKMPEWYDPEFIDEKHTDNFNLLKEGSHSLMRRLKYIGDEFKRSDYHNFVEKMTSLYRDIKDRPTEKLFTTKAKNKGVDKQVLGGIKKLMIDFCIRNEDEIKRLPASTKAVDMNSAIAKCEAFKFGEP